MSKDELESALAKIDKLTALNEEKRNDIARLRRKNHKLENEIEKAERSIALLLEGPKTPIEVPSWVVKVPKRKKDHYAIPHQMFSDWHLGEKQPPNEVGGFNAYDDKIAEKRVEYTANSSVKVIKEYTAGLKFPGIVLPFAGDIVTGEIHDELKETNTETLPETIKRWTPKIISMIEMYANEFDEVFVPAVMGNHSRRGAKMKHKNQARDSYDWLMFQWIAHHFKDDPQVQIAPADSLDYRFQTYDTRFLLTHGYFGGGTGSSTIGRVMATRQKMHAREYATGMPFDVLLTAHYHTTIFGPGVVQCGCLKGIDAYAYDINCVPEPPSQALFFVTPERGITMKTEIFAEGPNERKLWDKVAYYKGN